MVSDPRTESLLFENMEEHHPHQTTTSDTTATTTNPESAAATAGRDDEKKQEANVKPKQCGEIRTCYRTPVTHKSIDYNNEN